MATKTKPTETPVPAQVSEQEIMIVAAKHSRETLQQFRLWIVGDTPLITHAWSEKAKRQMLEKQEGKTKKGREAKIPENDFLESLYPMGEKGAYGFPAMGLKNAIVSAAHKDKNIPKTLAQSSLFIHGDMTRLMPGKAGAICDMPLVRIWAGAPEMREDMVKIGSGLNKVANLSYRGQFTFWAMEIRGNFNPYILNQDKLARIISDAGIESGLGEWRNEKRGIFGSFHIATPEEAHEWKQFSRGEGPLPTPYELLEAAE